MKWNAFWSAFCCRCTPSHGSSIACVMLPRCHGHSCSTHRREPTRLSRRDEKNSMHHSSECCITYMLPVTIRASVLWRPSCSTKQARVRRLTLPCLNPKCPAVPRQQSGHQRRLGSPRSALHPRPKRHHHHPPSSTCCAQTPRQTSIPCGSN
jgi:hypothetical protein